MRFAHRLESSALDQRSPSRSCAPCTKSEARADLVLITRHLLACGLSGWYLLKGGERAGRSRRADGGADDPVVVARAGVAARVRRWLSGPGAHRWTPRALMVVLAGGACAPLLLSGQADPGLVALAAATAASVGGNVLSEVLTDGVDQLRDHPDEMDAERVQDWLEAQFTRVLEAGGQQATVLEAELALLLDEVGAGQAAVAEAVRLGHEETAHRMRAGLAEMDEHLAAVGSRLEDLHITADEILRDVRLLLDR